MLFGDAMLTRIGPSEIASEARCQEQYCRKAEADSDRIQ